jgi:hypothetical protein
MRSDSNVRNVLETVIEGAIFLLIGLLTLMWLRGGIILHLGPAHLRAHRFGLPLALTLIAFAAKYAVAGDLRLGVRWEAWLRGRLPRRVGLPDVIVAGTLLLAALIAALSLANPIARGLRGRYYANSAWEGRSLFQSRDATLTLDTLQQRFPALTQQYSIAWAGALAIPAAGDYHFRTISKDGSAVLINDQLVVDNYGEHEFRPAAGAIRLERGLHAIRVEYQFFDGLPGEAGFKIQWQPPGGRWRLLTSTALVLDQYDDRAFALGQVCEILLALLYAAVVVWVVGALVMAARRFGRLPAARRRAVGLVALVLAVFIGHFFLSDNMTSFDSMWAVPTALSILREGNTDLDEYADAIAASRNYGIERLNGHLYNFYPQGTTWLSLPVIYLLDQLLARTFVQDFRRFLQDHPILRARPEVFVASLMVALTTLLIYLWSERRLQCPRDAALIAGIFAYGTSAWSTASRALWQHGPTALLLSLTLYLLLAAGEGDERRAAWRVRLSSLPLAFAFLVRPTNAVAVIGFSLVVLWQYRRHFLAFVLWSGCVALPFFWYNAAIYGAALPSYFVNSRQLQMTPRVFEALAGLLISPARGLFIFTPVLGFAVYGMALKIRSSDAQFLDYALIAMLVAHWIFSALHPNWWGGHSYGPRYFTDVLPYFMYFLAPALQSMRRLCGLKKIVVFAVFWLTVTLSVFIHYRGATDWAVFTWNASPAPIDRNPHRVWDWGDIQFLRGLTAEHLSAD